MAEGAKRVRGTRLAILLLLLAMTSIAAALFILYRVDQVAQWDRDYIALSVDSSSVAENIARLADDITRGLPPDTRNMEGLRLTFEDNIYAMREGDEFINLPPAPAPLQENIDALEAEFQPMSDAIDEILDRRAAYVLIQQEAAAIENLAPEVTAPLESAISTLATRSAPAEQITLTADLLVQVNQLPVQAAAVSQQGYDADTLATELAANVDALSAQLRQLLSGEGLGFQPARIDTVDAAVADALAGMQQIRESVTTITEEATELAVVQSAAAEISRLRNNVKFTAENNVQQSFLDYRDGRQLEALHGYVLGGITVILLVIFVTVLLRQARARARELEDADAAQQEAILRLLDEITTLADGDLTVDVTVTEDFTGAIADSINYTIDTLRSLVGTITATSDEITQSASGTEAVTQQLNAASRRQADEINSVSQAIGAMSQSMQQVSHRADELAQDAQASVETAHTGSETVRRTVDGMTALRDQIQETAKRIKRLGESSQEIGNIIEFINDIAEQTNTLALNASIQAAMAGEAGRGFAVVAEEVQRLAERAGNATRQIETLVKTIQADTNEAIVSMERSTTNVVSNAQLSEAAGEALDRIEASSTDLSRLISDISNDARTQTESATDLAGRIQVIQDIAGQTQVASDTTASAVSNLNALSVKLRESVAGFKLPSAETADAEDLDFDDTVVDPTPTDEERDAA